MAKRGFSISEALGEGFRVTGRRPLSVWVWGLITLLPSLVPMLLMFQPMMNLSLADMGDAAALEHDPALAAMMVQGQLANILSLVLQLVCYAVLGAAIYRAVLAPKSANRRPFALGFGMDEVRVGVIYLALFVGFMVMTIVLVLITVGVGVAAWPRLTEAGQAWTVAAMIFVTLAVLLAAYGRVCLMAPVSVARGDFSFEEGWRLGAGQTGKLALLTLVVWVLVLAVVLLAYAVVLAIGMAIWMGLGLSMAVPDNPASFRDLLPADPRVLWLLGALSLPVVWLYGLVTTIGMAPYASAVRQLILEPAVDAPASGDLSES